MGLRARGSPLNSADARSGFTCLVTVPSLRGKPNLNNSEPFPSTRVSVFPFPARLPHAVPDLRFSVGLPGLARTHCSPCVLGNRPAAGVCPCRGVSLSFSSSLW